MEVEFLSWDVRYFYFLRLYLMEPVGSGWVRWIMSFGDLLVSCPLSLQGWGSRHTSPRHILVCVLGIQTQGLMFVETDPSA